MSKPGRFVKQDDVQHIAGMKSIPQKQRGFQVRSMYYIICKILPSMTLLDIPVSQNVGWWHSLRPCSPIRVSH